jgi:ribonuclease HII
MKLQFEKIAGDPVMGIDEAGRGPLAGPVFAAAVHLPLELACSLQSNEWSLINDSKKLSEKKRDFLAEVIKNTNGCIWAIASASAEEIDRFNILRATHIAMKRAHDEVTAKFTQIKQIQNSNPFTMNVLVDGLAVSTLPHAQNIVKGDAKSLLIAAASILAKTARDSYCMDMDAKYPGYGFAKHKGYPTAAHFAVLRELGPCPEHRRSFGPVSQLTLF